MSFLIEAVPASYLDRIRSAGRDEAGNPLAPRIDEEGGTPLRCCLRESLPGERLLLIAYTPPGTAGAYAERGPLFVHAEDCPGYATVTEYPPGLAHRRQIVRAYDERGDMGEGALVEDGEQGAREIARLLAEPGVAIVHVRNVVAGCYNFCAHPA
ncbi:DUF1203 domain-containing protein [Amycolatopsis rhizosphaerae]|uniref:DUF1203 domain-containing protein n=1 Tax=Amycolatopsis rhizosphaerae TaxID=2053003 RepID=A0A558D185_9PSEU|nr:DUF1203 domain-containing protein [Amycolatopsis rhizosphaerae]TVT54784.1 DUF1203 domain-containing protein [Amycolatopsis rhizosphaerae]